MNKFFKFLMSFVYIASAYSQTMSPGVAATGVYARYTGPAVTSGTTTYYWVQAIYPSGRAPFSAYSSASLPASLGPASISFVNIGWNAMPGAIAYDILKTTSASTPSGACNCALRVNNTTNALTDDGLASLTYSVSTGAFSISPIVTAIDTATLTVAQIYGTVLNGTPTAAANYTLPTAALIVASLPVCSVGASFLTTIRNTSAGANTITVLGGTASTVTGTATIAQSAARQFITTVTNCSTAATTSYSLMTGAF